MKRQQATLPVRRRRDFHAQVKDRAETSIGKLQSLTEKGTSPRDSRYVAKANITPDEEFKTEIHSTKREADRKFIGALTKFHYRRVERNNDKLQRAKSDKSISKRDTDRAKHNATCLVKQFYEWSTLFFHLSGKDTSMT